MLRLVFNAAALVSALLLALTLAAWLRSHQYSDILNWMKTDGAATRRCDVVVISGAGGLDVAWADRPVYPREYVTAPGQWVFVEHLTYAPTHPLRISRPWGAQPRPPRWLWFIRPLAAGNPFRYDIVVPYRTVALAAGVLPAAWPALLWLRRHRRRRYRASRGLCIHCGYDLHGNVSGVCPECGKSRGEGLRGDLILRALHSSARAAVGPGPLRWARVLGLALCVVVLTFWVLTWTGLMDP